MAGRTAALGAALVMIGLIAFLTVGSMMEEDGITAPLAILSLVILIVIGVGVIGALTHPPEVTAARGQSAPARGQEHADGRARLARLARPAARAGGGGRGGVPRVRPRRRRRVREELRRSSSGARLTSGPASCRRRAGAALARPGPAHRR